MARKSVEQREKKRERVYLKYKKAREKVKKATTDINLSPEERFEAQIKLQRDFPRDASKHRQRKACKLCGRPRSVYRIVKVCRMCFRNSVMKGIIPGMRKASW